MTKRERLMSRYNDGNKKKFLLAFDQVLTTG
jgi:hypothetical protein